jgi:hypothetical protein
MDMGTLSADQAAQQQQILRQQRMAEMLMQQGMQQPQGQMISGRYVAPSIFQNLAGLANTYVGQQGIEKAEDAQLKLAKAIRGQEGVALADYMSQLQGRPAKPAPAGYELGDAGTPAVAGNPMLANMNALQNPNSPAFLRQFAMGEIIKKPKWEKAEYTDPKSGVTRQGVIDVNSPNPISTFQVGGTKPEMTAAERIGLNMRGAELFDKGIGGFSGYGAPSGGQPMVRTGAPVGQPQNQPAGQPAFTPSTLPTYQNDPSLSPAQNRDQALKFSEKQQSNVINAKDSFDLMKAAGSILASNAPSSGLLSNLTTYAGEVANLPYGARKQESEADAQLKMLSGALTMKQPRFEGPQGVLDVTLYQKLAGDLGNANIPTESRLATMKQMVNLQKKYYPAGDWDSIDTQLKDTGKVSLGASKQPSSTPTYAVNPQTGERIMSTDNGKNWKPAR